MGECGCISCGQHFKLKAPKGWYIIRLVPGCDYCGVGSGVFIDHPEAVEGFYNKEDIKEIPELPTLGNRGKFKTTTIKCGLDPDEARKAAIKCFSGTETEDNKIDNILAEILGEDFWKGFLTESPRLITPKENNNDKD